MKKCKCGCKQSDGKEMFCIACFHNFDSLESFHTFNGIHLCPRCHPKDDKWMYICRCGGQLDLCPSDWPWNPDFWICNRCKETR